LLIPIFTLFPYTTLFRSLLATCMLFDWVIKENHSTITARFAFGKVSFKKYLLQNALLYTGLLFLFDLCTMVLFHLLLNERMSIRSEEHTSELQSRFDLVC